VNALTDIASSMYKAAPGYWNFLIVAGIICWIGKKIYKVIS
jgi:hypothetical protein